MLVTPVVSLPHSLHWSQVIEYVQPSFHCIIAVTVFGRNAKNTGKTMTQMVMSAELTTVEQVYDVLLSCKRLAEDSGVTMHFSSVYFADEKMMCAAEHGMVCLKRAGRLGRVVVAGAEMQVRMGRQLPEDVVVLATEASGFFVNEVEQKFAQGYETDTIITSIIPGVQGSDEQQPCAMAFISQDLLGEERPAGGGALTGATHVDSAQSLATTDGSTRSESLTATRAATSDSEQHNRVEARDSTEELRAPTRLGMIRQLSQATAPDREQRHNHMTLQFREMSKKAARRLSSTLSAGLHLATRSIRQSSTLLSGEVYLDQDRHRKMLRSALVVVVAVACIGGLWWWYARSQERARQEATELVAPFVMQLQSAQELVGEDPLAAREQVARVVSQLEELQQSDKQNGVSAEFITYELSRAREVFTAISGKEELSELPIFYDLRLIRSDFVASIAHGNGNRAVFIDQGKQQAAVLDLRSKQLSLISLEAVGQVRSAVLQDNELFVLSDGVFALPVEDGSEAEQIIEAGDSNAGGQLLGAYERYLYVLNPEKRNIYRYMQEGDEYSQPIGWLQSSLGSSLQETVALAIDGDVWLTTQAGEIRKFTSGRQQEFTVKGLPEPFLSTIQLVTATDLEQLYILDPNNARLVLLDKDGAFLREVKHASLASATAVVVSTQLQKVFVLSGSMIFEVTL